MFLIAILLTGLAFFCRHIVADCECGYSINSTSDSQHAVFTELLESDFLHLQNIEDNTDWAVQSYVSPATSSGDYGKDASIANVQTNPIADRHHYSGPGINGPDPGLELYVRPAGPPGGTVPVAEVVTKRSDIMFGSFRISMKYGSVDGTCGSMFFYFNDTNEIDIEFLSTLTPKTPNTGNSAPAYLVLHSADSAPFTEYKLPFLPQDGYHEYRFDWTPGRVSFYIDDKYIQTFTTGLPIVPGRLHMFHWSNGNQGWTRGPPTENAVQTVSYVKAYFNSTDPLRQSAHQSRCRDATKFNAVCEVPKLSGPPDPSGGTKMTHFFNEKPNMAEGQINYVPPEYPTPT